MSIGARPEQEAADAKAADEDRQDGRRRRSRRAEDQPEVAQPADLIDEGAEAGTEQQESDQPGSKTHEPNLATIGSIAGFYRHR